MIAMLFRDTEPPPQGLVSTAGTAQHPQESPRVRTGVSGQVCTDVPGCTCERAGWAAVCKGQCVCTGCVCARVDMDVRARPCICASTCEWSTQMCEGVNARERCVRRV